MRGLDHSRVRRLGVVTDHNHGCAYNHGRADNHGCVNNHGRADHHGCVNTALASTTTAAVNRQGVGQVEQTAPTTTVVPTAVEGVVLSRTGSSTLPLFFTGVVLVLFGTVLEFARRRKLQMLTLRPFHTVGISDVLRQMARSRQAVASKPVRVSDLAPARTHPPARDACLWRYRIW